MLIFFNGNLIQFSLHLYPFVLSSVRIHGEYHSSLVKLPKNFDIPRCIVARDGQKTLIYDIFYMAES